MENIQMFASLQASLEKLKIWKYTDVSITPNFLKQLEKMENIQTFASFLTFQRKQKKVEKIKIVAAFQTSRQVLKLRENKDASIIAKML